MQSRDIRIGTRGSPLAMRQTGIVRDGLVSAGVDRQAIAVETITTSGDRIQDRPLAEAGGKGLFTKEIEQALLDERIDLAVHSMKDLETVLPEGLSIACYLPREDVRDVLISANGTSFATLPKGAVLGTASLRRQAQARRLRPDLKVVPLRGNVETRLAKLERGEVDATLLALAGLKRLGLEDRATAILDADEFLPAIAQGAIGVQIRAGDSRMAELLQVLDHAQTRTCIACERAFLARLDGSCHTPMAGLAQFLEGRLLFRGMILTPDGSECHETSRQGASGDAQAMGRDAAEDLLARAGPNFLEAKG